MKVVSKAIEYINLAHKVNLDIVKFQIYSGETLVNKFIDPDCVKHFDKFAFSVD